MSIYPRAGQKPTGFRKGGHDIAVRKYQVAGGTIGRQRQAHPGAEGAASAAPFLGGNV